MIRDVETQGFPQRLNPRAINPAQSSYQRFKNPVVDEEKCVGCSLCLNSCSFHAIQMIAGKAHIQEEMCRGCRDCIPSCPHGAIS
ncbi:MAG: 4Fe-4S binding protein [Candidatus Heimdallarchaeaceae archaeon]